jgi:copper transport protein
VLLVVGLLGFGARALRGRSGSDGRPRSGAVAGELALAALALGAGAFLTLAVPAVGARFEPLPLPSPSTASSDVDDLTVTASIRPNRPGANLVTIAVLETRRPSLGPIEGVRVELVSPDGGVLTESAPVVDGVAEFGLVEIGAPGELTVRVAVDRPVRPVGAVEMGWVVDPRPIAPAPTVLSDAPLRRIAAPFGVALLVIAAGIVVLGRRGRLTAPPEPTAGGQPGIAVAAQMGVDLTTQSANHEEPVEAFAR